MSNTSSQDYNTDDIWQIKYLRKCVNSFVYYILIAYDLDDILIKGCNNITDLLKARYQDWFKNRVFLIES